MDKLPNLTANGIPLDMSPSAFGWLPDSTDYLSDVSELRARLQEDGYLFLRGILEREKVEQVRIEILKQEFGEDYLLKSRHAKNIYMLKSIQNSGNIPVIRKLIHSGIIVELFSNILGGPARAFDYVWSRVIGPGNCETPHCDTVYMNYGTKNLYTTWIPLNDIPVSHGPLMVLEKSHRFKDLDYYRSLDVDKNRILRQFVFKHWKFFRGFHYSKDAKKIQKEFGVRWLTADFQIGDILIFSVDALHGSLDNVSENLRLVLDARYQLATEPIDFRYVGVYPIGHSKPMPLSFSNLSRLLRNFIQKRYR